MSCDDTGAGGSVFPGPALGPSAAPPWPRRKKGGRCTSAFIPGSGPGYSRLLCPRPEPWRLLGVNCLVMLVRIPLTGLLSAAVLLGPRVATAQSRVIDEGAFVVVKAGAPARTESFKISRSESSITATGSVSGGGQTTTS